MTTSRVLARIPAVTVGLALGLALVSCGSDEESSDTTSAVVAEVTTTTAGAPTGDTATNQTVTIATVAPEITVATVAPEITIATVAPAAPDAVTIAVTAGVDSGDDRIERIPLGATVTLIVINPDRDDEFHVHGYELGDGVEVPAGQPETFTFVADQAGQFEVESHTTEVVLVILDVS